MTVYNDPYPQPAEPRALDVRAAARALPLRALGEGGRAAGAAAGLGGVGAVALQARDMLAEQWGVGAEVWSVTSWGELRRDGVECERHNLVHPDAQRRTPYVTTALEGTDAPVVAVSDWMSAVPDLVRQWVPAPFTTLGTDGFGLSDTRPAVRRHFNVDAESITVAALASLAARGEVDRAVVAEAADKYRIDDPQAAGPQTTDAGVA
jgi:pyruvate dehydrogenase E1 component